MFEMLGINFHWYGLLIGIGAWLAVEIAIKNRGALPVAVLEKAIGWTILAGIIGARAYHVADFWNEYYSNHLINVLYLWEGGLGIWGAVGGGMVGLFLFCYFRKGKFLKFLDVIVLGVPLAQAIGRVGNFVNGELYGKNGEPLFAYEGVLNVILFLILWRFSKRKWVSGQISGIYLLGYGVIRILLENLRSEGIIWKIGGVPMAVICGVAAILVGSYLIFWQRKQV
jgi:phosphatidylglycerol---prolipoprotein diacylglyceryl transferase